MNEEENLNDPKVFERFLRARENENEENKEEIEENDNVVNNLPPIPANLESLSLADLKALAEGRGLKRKGIGWESAAPPTGKKTDIIAELRRLPGAKRPKARGHGWLPPNIQDLEDRCAAWVQDHEDDGDDADCPLDYAIDEGCTAGVHQHVNEKAHKSIDDDDCCTYYCSICRQEVDWREWHCAGCNTCQYGVAFPCSKCTPAMCKIRTSWD